jgi:DNA polymerase-3 subunit epsilon/ATP-dependent DNA helicase DinG
MSLEQRVREALRPDGALARRWRGFEDRAEQRDLAERIAATLDHGGVLLAEAPTGLGKSLAYLLPSVLLAAEGRARVVIATCTRSLQDQLVERDVPAVLESLGLSLPVVRLKGKQNYLCTASLELAEARGAEEAETLEELRRWAARDPEGDLDRFAAGDPESYRRVRPRVAADATACTLATCRRGRECFWVRARRLASQAPLLIVNHALLALSGEVEGLLPEFDVLIVDEAHRLEGVLLAQLERSVSRHRIEELLRLVGTGRATRAREGGGLLARLRGFALPLLESGGRREIARDELDRLSGRVTSCRHDAEALFSALIPARAGHPLYGTRERYRSASDLLGKDLSTLEAMLVHCDDFARSLHRVAESLEGMGAGAVAQDLAAELDQVSGRWSALGTDLSILTDASERGWVYWRTASSASVELHGAPIHVGDHARRSVLSRARAAGLTSATLSASGDFSFIAERLGLGEDRRMPYEVTSHPSPFPLERQMRAFVYTGAGEEMAVAELVAELARTGRNQLVLFTAHERLRRAREHLVRDSELEDRLLAQNWDGTASALSDRFRRARGAILLGVQSLWEGVDFPGETLEIVVVAKLPFSVPDDPLVEARGERLRENGLDAFRHDALPEAVLRFRQGVGRLIRRVDDRGVLVVCDPRLLTASYRQAFLAALPVTPVACRDAGELAREAERFLSEGVVVEEPQA